MGNLKFDWTRINNDSNGNPRYVLHFLNLCTRTELDADPWSPTGNKYGIAVKRANRIGGKKYHTKSYGGGIVFQTYNLEDTEISILRVLQEDQSKQAKVED